MGSREGLKVPAAIKLDHVQTVPKTALKHFVGTVTEATFSDVCRAFDS